MLNLGGIQVQIQHANTFEDLVKLAKEVDELREMIRERQLEIIKDDPALIEMLLGLYG